MKNDRNWEWSDHWLWFTGFAVAATAVSWFIDPEKGFRSVGDYGRSFLCILVSQFVAIHLHEQRTNGANYRSSYASFGDWFIVTALRGLMQTVGYFVAVFILLLFLAGGGFEPRR